MILYGYRYDSDTGKFHAKEITVKRGGLDSYKLPCSNSITNACEINSQKLGHISYCIGDYFALYKEPSKLAFIESVKSMMLQEQIDKEKQAQALKAKRMRFLNVIGGAKQ